MGEGKRKPIFIGLRGSGDYHRIPWYEDGLELNLKNPFSEEYSEEFSEISRVSEDIHTTYADLLNGIDDPDTDRLFELFDDDVSEASFRVTLSDIAAVAQETLDPYHSGYLNAMGSQLRDIVNELTFCEAKNRVSVNDIRRVQKKLERSRGVDEVKSLEHSKLYLSITYELYKRGVIADDSIAEDILTIIFDKGDTSGFPQVYVDVIENVLVLSHGSVYSTKEETELKKDLKRVGKLFSDHESNDGNFLKAIFVLKNILLEDSSAIDYFEAAGLFEAYTGIYPSQEEIRALIDILFAERGANKFAFLMNWENEFSNLLEISDLNCTYLRNAIDALVRSYCYLNNNKLSRRNSYERFKMNFNGCFSVLDETLPEGVLTNEYLSGLLENIKNKLKQLQNGLNSPTDWNDISIIMFLLKFMDSQTKVPLQYYDIESDEHPIDDYRQQISDRLGDRFGKGIEMERLNSFNIGPSDIFLSRMKFGRNWYSMVFELAPTKDLQSVIAKINSGKIPQDMLRARVGIPNELPQLNDITLEDYCCGVATKVARKLGATTEDISSIKASLLDENESWNPFSKSLRTFKFIVKVPVNSPEGTIIVPMEIMMVLYYPKDHLIYKEAQSAGLRTELGLLNCSNEISKAVEYMFWKYFIDININEENIFRLNSIVKTVVDYFDQLEFVDKDVLPMLESLIEKFKNQIPEEMKVRFAALSLIVEEDMENQFQSEGSEEE